MKDISNTHMKSLLDTFRRIEQRIDDVERTVSNLPTKMDTTDSGSLPLMTYGNQDKGHSAEVFYFFIYVFFFKSWNLFLPCSEYSPISNDFRSEGY